MRDSKRQLGVGLLAILLLGWSGCSYLRSSLRFTVLVEDAAGLEADRPVMLRDQQVGSVTSVSVKSEDEARIEVLIAREHRDEIYKNASFSVGTCPDGLPCLLIENQPGKQESMEEGDVVDTRPGWLERLSRNLRKLGESAGETVERFKTDLEEALTSLRDSPEAQALKEGLIEFGHDLSTMARGRMRQFVSDELPKLEDKAKAYREKLEKEGRREEAEIFWKWFTRWADGMRRAAGELKAEAEPEQ